MIRQLTRKILILVQACLLSATCDRSSDAMEALSQESDDSESGDFGRRREAGGREAGLEDLGRDLADDGLL